MKFKKTISIMIITMILVMLPLTSVKASDKSIWELGKEWLSIGEQERENAPIEESVYTPFEDLAGMIWGIAVVVILASGMVLGIRFMLSTPDKKAELKKGLIIFSVGSVVILGALGIWRMYIDILEKMAH